MVATNQRAECPECGNPALQQQATGFSSGHDEWSWEQCPECGWEGRAEYDNSKCPGRECSVHGDR
jgi:predicted RNA-binding Zn-ribbon protein involved in translation (DUF1610 family)